MNRFRGAITGLCVALLATTLTALVRRFVLVPAGIDAPLMPFLMAILAAAWISGLSAGLAAMVMGLMLAAYGISQNPEFDFHRPRFQGRLTIYTVVGVLTSWMMAALRSAQRRSEERRRRLEEEVAERRNVEVAEREQRERLTMEMRRREHAEMTLRDREERMRLAIESADIGTWDFNPLTGERQWSERAKLMFGLPPDADVTNVTFLDRVHPEDRQRASLAVERALDPNGDGAYDIDCRLVWPDGSVHWFIVKGQSLFEGEKPNRRPIRFLGTVLEITDRKQAEDALCASENRLKAILNNTSAVIYLKDRQSRYLMVNRRFEQLFGITQQQIVGKTDADVFPSDVVAKLQANDRQVQETGQSLEFEEVVPHEDGLHTYVSVKFPIYDAEGQCQAVGGISTDISDRKRTADALEAEQELLRHTIVIQDHQRELIAYEIHDGLVQYATGALMQLESVRDRVESPAVADQLAEILGILQKTVAEGRRIINGIRTPVLDDWGVVAALEQLIDEEDRAHVHVEFIKDASVGRMEHSIEEALYRITQEAMNNVHKHSQSKHVRVELARRGDRVHLEVRDSGIGFTPSNGAERVHGLMGMTERARIAGGRCTIESSPGRGTQIIVDLPYVARGSHDASKPAPAGRSTA